MYDVAIVGMGPAGMTAAVYAARKKLKTLLIGKEWGGQIARTSEVENYMGFQLITGQELMRKFEEQVNEYPVEKILDEVISAGSQKENFIVATKGGQQYFARTLIIATGKQPRWLNVPGEKEFIGKGVSYCSICDAPLFQGKKVAVIGGGNSAITAAYDLIKIASHVYVVSLDDWKSDPALSDKIKDAPNLTKMAGYQTLSINGEQTVKNIFLKSVREPFRETNLEVQGVFIEIGTVPTTDFLSGFINLNDYGEIVVDCSCNTSVPGVFASGDATTAPEKQVIVAAGEGAKAALSAFKYILEN
ncbi:MAG: NADH dehydrogenase [Pelotomaculum sp. PtaB.Bin013]|uniref:FAD-dependent oxidoreductase n=1 Tax=Pelotomaculum isophthalicicum JI TaxID=947010 RepID=A0A9X4H4R5_9FIRM|nr:FAD-dependent oxidoreductase [Pelotomaculum isophthalicicum]MDF9408943.1 FAD-dependent oxidoreductase [Pelotomaculum isophthalicicum JI]OPX87993.1 MAG: NADH dehydrogenase [Pelotomaculum sp. PtaB.Bin013]